MIPRPTRCSMIFTAGGFPSRLQRLIGLGSPASEVGLARRGRCNFSVVEFICGFVRTSFLFTLLTAFLAGEGISGAAGDPSVIKTKSFDRDPNWEGFNNRITPEKIPTIVQDFGYSDSNFAGKERGEIGGQVWRAAEPAFYADKIPPRTLNDKLTASG